MTCELSFAERLGDLMELRQINGKKLSEITGIPPSNISDMLNGKRENPTMKQIIKLSKSLNISSDYLLGLSDIKSTDLDIKDICNKLGLSETSVSNIIRIYDNARTGNVLDIKGSCALDGLLSCDLNILLPFLNNTLDYVLFAVDKDSTQEVTATVSAINSISFKVSEQVIKNAIIHDIQATLDYLRNNINNKKEDD